MKHPNQAQARTGHDTRSIRRAALASLAVLAATVSAAAVADNAGSVKPAAVDLLGFFWGDAAKTMRPLSLSTFASPSAGGQSVSATILAKPEMPSTAALSWEGIDEKRTLAGQSPSVVRHGKALSIAIKTGHPVQFGSWRISETRNAEGDGAKYLYGGRFGKAGLHRVVAYLEHDSPGTYFVSPTSGNALFVHPGDGPFVASPNADYVFAQDENGPRFAFAIANLTETGPSRDLGCSVDGAVKSRLSSTFRGWIAEPFGFDLVVTAERQDGSRDSLPLRFVRSGGQWHGFAADPAAAQRIIVIRCVG